MQTRPDEIGGLLQLTRASDPRTRTHAVVHLCPCHVRRNDDRVWDRVLTMAEDRDAKVRNAALHVLTDGSPRSRESQVVGVLERMYHEPDAKLRRKARHILTQYRRTGDLNIS